MSSSHDRYGSLFTRLRSPEQAFFAVCLFSVLAVLPASCTFRFARETPPEAEVPAEGFRTLDKFPFREAWYGMYFQEDKVGYSHFKIESVGSDFMIKSDSIMRLTALKKTNEIVMKEEVQVRPDLSLLSFRSAVTMNDKTMEMTGNTEGDKFSLEMRVDGERLTRSYPIGEKLYHSSAVSLMPALRGLKDGRKYSFGVFNAEKQGLQQVEQQAFKVRGEPGPNGAVWKVVNAYGRSTVHSWLDKKGLTVLERGLEGSLVTMIEEEETAKKFLEKKTSSKDLILDFSLIKIPRPLPNPERLRLLKVRMRGIDPTLISGLGRQTVLMAGDGSGSDGFNVTVQVEDLAELKRAGKSPSQAASDNPDDGSPAQYLKSSFSIQSEHPEITAQAQKIVSRGDTPLEKVAKLVRWTADNIKNKMEDSFTALSVLRSREGECQAHAGLYTALARSQGIPTRVVTGLVYGKDMGFMYHAWAESYVNRWIAVDPTLNQMPADATHIKLAAADDGDSAASLFKMAGKIQLDVLEYE